MTDESTIREQADPRKHGIDIITHIGGPHLAAIGSAAINEAKEEIARRIVAEFLSTRLQDVVARLDVAAIANLAALEVGGTVGKSLRDNLRKSV